MITSVEAETNSDVSRECSELSLGVLILNYNYGQFVAEAITSVLTQNPPFDEVIVVDDGSTDNSIEVIKAFLPRIKLITKTNGGQLSASLAGLSQSTTKYVYFLDADDFVGPNFVSIAKSRLSGDPVKLQFQLMAVDEHKTLLDSVFPTYPEGYSSEEMVVDNKVLGFYLCPPTSGNIYARRILADMRLDGIDSYEPLDGSPGLSIPYLGRIRSENVPLVFYRIHGRSHSRWERPDANVLQYEVDWFYRRWSDVCGLLNFDKPPFGDEEPVYVLERRVMLSALQSKPLLIHVRRYVTRLLRSRLSTKQRALLCLWAMALFLPNAKWRRKLVLARRSPINRSKQLKRAIRTFSGSRAAH